MRPDKRGTIRLTQRVLSQPRDYEHAKERCTEWENENPIVSLFVDGLKSSNSDQSRFLSVQQEKLGPRDEDPQLILLSAYRSIIHFLLFRPSFLSICNNKDIKLGDQFRRIGSLARTFHQNTQEWSTDDLNHQKTLTLKVKH